MRPALLLYVLLLAAALASVVARLANPEALQQFIVLMGGMP